MSGLCSSAFLLQPSSYEWSAARLRRRVGTLPEKREGDSTDYTPLLHRDGSVFSVVYPSDLEQPE